MRTAYCLWSLIIFSLLSFDLYALDFSYNRGIDFNDPNVNEVMDTWKSYVESTDTLGISYTEFWMEEEIDQYQNYDFLSFEYGLNWYKRYNNHFLSVSYINDSSFVLRVQFTELDKENYNIIAIANYIVHLRDKESFISNFLLNDLSLMETNETKHIKYYFKRSHKFSDSKAQRMNRFIDSISILFDIDSIPKISFIFNNSWLEIQKLKGLDYYQGEGNQPKPQGRINGKNQFLFSGRGSELYKHEIMHLLLVPKFRYAGPLHEGIACLFGDHLGKDLDFHFSRLNDYLNENPDLDLNDLFAFRYMDEYTNPIHVISALFVQEAYKRSDIVGIKNLMTAGNIYPDLNYIERYFRSIKDVLGIKRTEINTFIRNKLNDS